MKPSSGGSKTRVRVVRLLVRTCSAACALETEVHVHVADEAEAHLRAIDAWWREQRPSAPMLFIEEVAAAFDLLSAMPISADDTGGRGSATYDDCSCERRASTSTTR